MSNVESHGPVIGTVTVRRKPALTYPSPVGNSTVLHIESTLVATQRATVALLPTPSPTRLSRTPELSQRHLPRRYHISSPLLPLYHPLGTLALSLPDLDPTVFGLPAPVAVFDDPTRRYPNRPRRPAAKVRDAEDPLSQPPLTTETPTPDIEVKEKSSPRRRRGGKRKRKEPEDGDATYPAKRPRNPRSSGIASGLARTVSREEGSPALSNATSAVDAGRGEPGEEKKRERRSTRSRGAITRRDSTASEETVTSGSRSMSGPNNTTTGEGDEATETQKAESGVQEG